MQVGAAAVGMPGLALADCQCRRRAVAAQVRQLEAVRVQGRLQPPGQVVRKEGAVRDRVGAHAAQVGHGWGAKGARLAVRVRDVREEVSRLLSLLYQAGQVRLQVAQLSARKQFGRPVRASGRT